MIVAKNLYKNYGHRMAISDVSFSVKKGEVLGFLGPNGAGKTTTMKILTGYMAPTRGDVSIEGVDIFEDSILAKQKLGYLPETPPVYGDMYVMDYLKFVAKLKLCQKDKIDSLVNSALQKVGIGSSVKNRLIKNLSKGFQQRVGLAQALVSNPEVLVLDEPTVGLDPKQVLEIRTLLKQLKGSHTIILSTHILREVQLSCDRVLIIDEGKIIAEESLKDLKQKMSVKRKIILKVRDLSNTLINQLTSLQGVLNATIHQNEIHLQISSQSRINEQIAQTVVAGQFGLLEMKELDFNLEDVFIRLTDKKEV